MRSTEKIVLRWTTWIRLIIALAVFGDAASTATAAITQAEFERLHAELQLAPGATWRSVPWKMSLLDGQRTAVANKRPLFIWAMDGHPLGCT